MRTPVPKIQRIVDTITHGSEGDKKTPLAWHNSGWCPWNWGDKIRKFENWVERKINSDYDKECKEAEKAQKEYDRVKKEWENLPHEERLMLQEANRIAMEQRYPNLIHSHSTMDQKKNHLDKLHEEFLDKNWAEIHKLPNDIQKIIIDGSFVIIGALASIITASGGVTLMGIAGALGEARKVVLNVEDVKITLEGLMKSNEDYFSTSTEYYNMDQENKNASRNKCEKEGYKPELRFIENTPKHLLDFSEWYIDINAGPTGGPAFSVGHNWSF